MACQDEEPLLKAKKISEIFDDEDEFKVVMTE